MTIFKASTFAVIAVLLMLPALGGCGVLAAPCRVTEAGARTVPVVGGAVGAVFGVCAEVID